MINQANESTLRYLRKEHKNWSEEKIKAEAQKIWDKYVEDNKDRLEELEKQNREAFDKSVESEFLRLLMDNQDKDLLQSNTFFVNEFNKRRRDYLWEKYQDDFKNHFRLKLNILKMLDNQIEFEVPRNYYEGEFYRLSLGYRGIGKNDGFASGIQSIASKGLSSKSITKDHVLGATEVGKYIHTVFRKSDYDIDWMVNTWLYKHLFLWATIKITKKEHHKDNIMRNKHTIEQKLNLEHYKNVSELV